MCSRPALHCISLPSFLRRYRREWESHVLSNLPFYSLLLPLFLEMCVARLEVRGESAAQDLVTVSGHYLSLPCFLAPSSV